MERGGRWSFTLHHLRKKIPRRLTLLRRAISRTARDRSWLLFSEEKQYIFIKILLINLQLGGGLARLRALCGEDALWGRAPWRSFLPLFRHLRLEVFGGSPFLPAGGGNLRFTSPIILLCGDISPPGLDVQCVKLILGFSTLPFIFP